MTSRFGVVEFFGIACPGALVLFNFAFVAWRFDCPELHGNQLVAFLGAVTATIAAASLFASYIFGVVLRLLPIRTLVCSRCGSLCSFSRETTPLQFCFRSIIVQARDPSEAGKVEDVIHQYKEMKLFVAQCAPNLVEQLHAAEAMTRFISGCFWSLLCCLALVPVAMHEAEGWLFYGALAFPCCFAIVAVSASIFALRGEGRLSAPRSRLGVTVGTVGILALSFFYLVVLSLGDLAHANSMLWFLFINSGMLAVAWVFLPGALRREVRLVASAFALAKVAAFGNPLGSAWPSAPESGTNWSGLS